MVRAVLRQSALGDVEVAHDLEPAEDARLCLLGELAQLVEHTVDATAHVEGVLARFEMDVGGSHARGVGQERVDQFDGAGIHNAGRGLTGLAAALFAGVLELAARAEVDGHRFVEAALHADDRDDASLDAHADLVDRDHVEGVRHGEHETAVVGDAQRHDAVAHDEVAREEADGVGLGHRVAEIDHPDAHLAGDSCDDLLLGDGAIADQYLAETLARVALPLDGAVPPVRP